METTQLDLFSTNYAESGNTDQLSSASGSKPFVEEGSTDGCDLFLPAAGNRNNDSTGTINNEGSNGNYWSSTPNGSNNAYNLNFNSSNVNDGTNNNNRYNGQSLRCVREFAESSVPSFPVFRISREQSVGMRKSCGPALILI